MERKRLLGLTSEITIKWHANDTPKLDAIYREKMIDAIFGNLNHLPSPRETTIEMQKITKRK